jgi:hypothetical protein
MLRDEVSDLIKRTKHLPARKKELENEVKHHKQAFDEAKENE